MFLFRNLFWLNLFAMINVSEFILFRFNEMIRIGFVVRNIRDEEVYVNYTKIFRMRIKIWFIVFFV